MKFDHIGARLRGGPYLVGGGVYEDAYEQPGVLQFFNRRGDSLSIPAHINSSFRRYLLPFLRNKGYEVGKRLARNFNHFVRDGHLHVKPGPHRLFQQNKVPFLNVPAVFPQVNHYSARPGEFGLQGDGHGIRFTSHSGLSQGRYVVNVYVQSGFHL